MGTTDHGALERWVTEGHYLKDLSATDAREIMTSLYEQEYRKVFSHEDRYAEGLGLCLDWLKRQDWSGRTVLTAEVKENFTLDTSAGPVPFNYIWDRCDRLDNGDIEIVDYKTSIKNVQPQDLRNKIQARAYGLAAQLKFPDAKRIWVTFDMLRYDPVSTAFTPEQNAEMHKYLLALAERILADEEGAEQLNPECRFCMRKQNCATLAAHIAAGGPLGITDPNEASDKRAKLKYAAGALDQMIKELDEVILDHAEQRDERDWETETTRVAIAAKKTRWIDPAALADVVGSDVLVGGGKVSITYVDKLLKGSELTAEQKAKVRRLIRSKTGDAFVITEPLSPIR